MAAEAKSPSAQQTPDEIVVEIERTRDQLAHTIDALIDRASPRNVARRAVDSLKAAFFEPDGSPRPDRFAKVGGALAGVVVVVVVLRRVVGGD